MIRRPPRSTRTDTPFPTRRSSDLVLAILLRCRAGPALERTAEARLLGIAEQGRDLVQRHFVLLQVLFAEFDALAFENVRKLQAVAAEIGLQRTHRRRSEEHTSELQSLMRISYAVFCLNNKNTVNS